MFLSSRLLLNGNLSTSINMPETASSAIEVYPNPISNSFQLHTNSSMNDAIVKLYNVQGQVVFFRKELNGNSANFDISNLQAGMYILELGNVKERQYARIIKK